MDADGDSDGASRSVLLHVVSPSAEAHRLTFPDTPLSTTIGEVKLMIQGAVASRPTPERQRLIYQGKPLVRTEATLESVLGREGEVIADAESFTLHLVLPPAAASNASRNGTSANPLQHTPAVAGAPNVQNLRNNLSSRPGSQNSNRSSTRGIAGSPMETPGTGPFAPPTGALPQPFQQFLGQSNTGQPANMSPPGFTGMPHHHHHHHHHHQTQHLNPFSGFGQPNPMNMPPHIQQSLNAAQQQFLQQNQGDPRSGSQRDSSREAGHENGQEQHPQNRSQTQTPTHSTVIREGQIPGGQWRITVNSTTVPINHHGPPNHGQPGQGQPSPGPQPPGATQTAPPNYNFQREFQNIRQALTEAQNQMMQLPGMAGMAGTSGIPGVRPIPPYMAPQVSHPSNFPPTVYLISSPTGYQAVLTSPSGSYVSRGLASGPPFNTFGSTGGRHPYTSNLSQRPHPTSSSAQPTNANNVDNPQAADRAGERDRHDVQAQARQQPGNEAADLIRIMMNIGGQIWVVIRLLGFIWLLTHGSSWFRTLLFGAFAAVFFLAQTGALAGPLRAAYEPIRRHVEDLLHDEPLAQELQEFVNQRALDTPPRADGAGRRQDAEDRQDPGNRQPGGDHQADAPRPGEDPPVQIPTQEDISQLLVRHRERRERNMGWAQRHFRRAERSIVLFAASLVPGVGEQHIRERENRARLTQAVEDVTSRLRERRLRQQQEDEARDEAAREERSAEENADRPEESMAGGSSQSGIRQGNLRQRDGFEAVDSGGVD